MEFRLTLKHQGEEQVWTESYNKPIARVTYSWGRYHPSNPLHGRTIRAVEEWGRALVGWFNDTLRPGEKQREFVSAEIIKAESEKR